VRFLAALLAAGLTLAVPALAQDLRTTVERHVEGAQRALVTELVEAVSIPSVAADAANVRRKAQFLEASLERRGFAAELLETDGNPLVFGERPAADADRTLLIYFHYDGQPVDPSRWQQEHPFQPILRAGSLADGAGLLDLQASEVFRPDDRIYARSVADDTAPIIALLGALDQREHVTHSQNPRGHAVGMECFQRLDGLAGADELDGHPGHGPHG